jgi:peptide/nickel transport system substrate-binding protein
MVISTYIRGGLVAAGVIAATTLYSSNALLAQESVFRVVVHADLRNLDPIATGGYITRNHGFMVYDTLFGFDENFVPQPQMVDTHEISDDQLTYTFTLRDGLLWHDGEPVTSADVIPSIRRWGVRDGMGQKLMEFVDDIRAVDDKTFELVLTEPFALVLESMAKIGTHPLFIMPQRFAEMDPGTQVPEMIGSGPFKFEADLWEPGNRIIYTKFEDYVPRDEPPTFTAGGKVVNFDRVEWLYMPDISTAMSAIQTGEIDMIEEVPPDLVSVLEAAAGVNVYHRDPFGRQAWLRLNHLVPPFDNLTVRQAVLAAVDQETYMQSIIGNPDYFKIGAAMFICDTPLATDAGGEEVLVRDLDKARTLLEEAGYDGEPVVIMQPVDIPLYSGLTLVTARIFGDIGMNVDLQAMDWGSVLTRRVVQRPIGEGGWSVLQTAWSGADLLNPINHLGVHGSGPDLAWPGWPEDEEIERLRDEFVRTTDAAEQLKIAEQLQVRAYEIVTYLPLGEYLQPTAVREEISGVVTSPAAVFWGVKR